MAVQFHRRNASLVLIHEVDGLEPHREWQLGGLKDGAGGDGTLAVAAITRLMLADVELAALVVATVRARKNRPAIDTGLRSTGLRCRRGRGSR